MGTPSEDQFGPAENTQLHQPDEQRGVFTDLLAGYAFAKVVDPIIEPAAQMVAGKIHDFFVGPDDDGDALEN